MWHNLISNPQVSEQLHKLALDIALLVGSLLAVGLKQALSAIRDSHMNVVKKMIAERLVTYAEQTMVSGGSEKAAYVAAQLKAKYPNLDEEEIKHLVEAAVYQMNQTIQGGNDAK